MNKSNENRPGGLKVASDQKPNFNASRRNLSSGIAAAGALLATGLLAPSDAQAHQWKRKWVRTGGRWKRIRKRLPRHRHSRPAPCFVKGTRIRTGTGERLVEELAVGDLLTTLSGEAKPIKWVGKTCIERNDEGQWNRMHVPVKLAQGALDGHLPERDLYVSGAHCFLIDGMLIPAAQLVNDRSITRCSEYAADTLELFHVELEEHHVLFAEGAPAESLLATAESRRHFDNYAEYVELFGAEVEDMQPYAPLVRNQDTVQAAKAQLMRVIAPIIDRRQPLEVVRDAIDELAFRKEAA